MATQRRLHGRVVVLLLLVSLLPVMLAAVGFWQAYGSLLDDRSSALQRVAVEHHASTIEAYLDARVDALRLAAASTSQDDLCAPGALQSLFDALSLTHGDCFIDLGVIDGDGRHLAYVGPYDLLDRNYRGADWFNAVLVQGAFVSDVFTGYRSVPHCVVAVRRDEPGFSWILRATIQSQGFHDLVRADGIGPTADCYIVNSEGIYQTPPRVGEILQPSGMGRLQPHQGVQVLPPDAQGLVRTTSWLNDGRWLLVVQQNAAEIRAPLRRATRWGVLIGTLAMALVIATTALATRHLTAEIDRVTAQREHLSQELLRSAKLASLGELSTGLAHEINNPLAIIAAEQTNIDDLVSAMAPDTADRDEVLASVATSRRQVDRCGAITAKMLQFGRHAASHPRLVRVDELTDEVVRLLTKQARVRNVMLRHDVRDEIPPTHVDPTELQQVLVNLINNALYASSDGGVITVTTGAHEGEVDISVADTGCGIAAQDLERVFQPFFTTKPVGQGTGLGLSVCFGIVRGWGGDIDVTSELGRGTRFTFTIPVQPAGNPQRGTTS